MGVCEETGPGEGAWRMERALRGSVSVLTPFRQSVNRGKQLTGAVVSLPCLQRGDRLYQVSVGQCLRAVDPLSHKGYVAMAICDGSSSQRWRLEG